MSFDQRIIRASQNLLLVVFFISSLICYSQDESIKTIDFLVKNDGDDDDERTTNVETLSNELFLSSGIIYPIDNKISSFLNPGIDISTGVNINLFKEKLYLGFDIGNTSFFSQYSDSANGNEVFFRIHIGTSIMYKVIGRNTDDRYFSLFPILGIYYNTFDYFYFDSDFNSNTNESLMTGNAISYKVGLNLRLSRIFHLEVCYEYLVYDTQIHKDLIDYYEVRGYYIDERLELDFSSINVKCIISPPTF